MIKVLNKFLANLGFSYCKVCGSKMVVLYRHGYDQFEVYKCPICDKKEIDSFLKRNKNLTLKGGEYK